MSAVRRLRVLQNGGRVAFSDVQLTGGIRSVLLSMQGSASQIDRIQNRLSTGRKVDSAIDDPIVFFAAKDHQNRAYDLLQLKDGIQEAVQVVTAADHGLTAITDLLTATQALSQTALGTTNQTARDSYSSQFDQILSQIDAMVADSSYKNKNLLNNDSLLVNFSDTSGQSTLNVAGVDASSSGLGVSKTNTSTWTSSSAIQASLDQVTGAVKTVRVYSQLLSNNSGILTVRRNFNDRMVNILSIGAENLTLADMNEEGANMLILQTRQSIQIVGMTMATRAAQGVIRLF